MPQINDILLTSNPWWKEDFRPTYHDREVFVTIAKYIPLPQMLAFTGLRRVGKTTIMLKIVSEYLQKGFDARNIVYFSFDEFAQTEIRDVIRDYEELLEKNLNSGNFLLLLDEIQKLQDWEDQLKRIYDTYSSNVKIIISGSESLFVRKGFRETLAGRIFEFRVDVLSFREFLDFRKVSFEPVGLYEKELVQLFDEYILTSGFPELAGIQDREIILKYIKEGIIEKVIYRDIPILFKVRDVAVLESLLHIILDEPGQLMELSELAQELGVSRQTVASYMGYLEQSFIIRKLYNYSKSRRKTERKLKKYYPAMLSDILLKTDTLSRSKSFESSVVTGLKSDFFWRDPYKHEVDIIFADKDPVPIEVKYGKIETSGIIAFMKKFDASRGYIISHNREEVITAKGFHINVVPAFKFFLKPETYLFK